MHSKCILILLHVLGKCLLLSLLDKHAHVCVDPMLELNLLHGDKFLSMDSKVLFLLME